MSRAEKYSPRLATSSWVTVLLSSRAFKSANSGSKSSCSPSSRAMSRYREVIISKTPEQSTPYWVWA